MYFAGMNGAFCNIMIDFGERWALRDTADDGQTDENSIYIFKRWNLMFKKIFWKQIITIIINITTIITIPCVPF